MSLLGQKRRFDPLPATSGPPQTTDTAIPARLVRFVPGTDMRGDLHLISARAKLLELLGPKFWCRIVEFCTTSSISSWGIASRPFRPAWSALSHEAAMRRQKADPHRGDRHYYDCPHCDKAGGAVFVGKDLQQRRVFECDGCGRKFGEPILESAARKRRLAD
jgi:hypothetical protein